MMSATASRTTVVGLGPMGSALARALLQAGVPTTVWNRTAARASPLVEAGAGLAPSLDEATRDSDLLIICLRDHESVREVLGSIDPATYAGRTVVNLTSSTPDEARTTATWAEERGMDYLSGAIMVPIPLIGDAEALVLYSGARHLFDRHVDRLRTLAGVADHLGQDHGLASLHDVAMLEIFFAGMTSFLHAAAMVTANGVETRTFLPYARQMLAILPESLDSMAAAVDADDHPGTEDNLAMELAVLDHISATSADAGLDGGLPDVMRDLAARAVDAGHGADGFSRIVDLLRRD
ncbi:NAD(P)-dependent oxidoreductase [Aeromicrobium sp. CF4.19]|uniref:NAD(P)-dependent oxidoreductase n=1 Tax=Aeromicrobium sp. CF4.19 TaxID=3373082 RepID=UPI003EE5969E